MVPTNERIIYNSKIDVVAKAGANVLTFQGQGSEEGLGLLLDNVKLAEKIPICPADCAQCNFDTCLTCNNGYKVQLGLCVKLTIPSITTATITPTTSSIPTG